MINNFLNSLIKSIINFIFIFIDIYISTVIFLREKLFYTPNIKKSKYVKKTLVINNQNHYYFEFGDSNAIDDNTIVMIGGIPTNPMESMSWLAGELIKLNSKYRILIFNIPFYENHFDIELSNTFATTNTINLIIKKSIDNKKLRVDPKYSHENQGIKVNDFLEELNINKCHLVGHDRGAVILEYFAINFPNKVLSYSRGSQVWNYIEPEWAKLAPDICVGPPHKIMSVYEQLRVLLFTVIHLKKPLELLSDLFEFKGRNAKRGTDLYDRYTHLKYKSQLSYKRYAKKFRNSLVQGGVYSEVKNRSNLKEKLFPIMQFQGEDEFKYNKSGTLISDQPYFGIYNLYRNEIEDVYPGCVGQDNDKYQSQFVTDKILYKEIKVKENARFTCFYLIPEAAHFNVVENPKACALVIDDFLSNKIQN